MFLEEGKVTYHERIAKDQYLMEICCPQVAASAVPGQFVNIRCRTEKSTDPLLRRPISIHKISKDKQSIQLYYLVVGRGTEALSKIKVDDQLSIVGPLGRGFELDVAQERVVLVGGGIGIAPLLALAEQMYNNNKEVISILGAANAEGLVRKNAFAPYGKIVEVTEDGSAGNKGLVTQFVSDYIKQNNTVIYSCGPKNMLKVVANLASDLDTPCQVSLEATMACGLGACLGCTCVEGKKGGYPKVCKDGPVFWTSEVNL